MTGGKKLFWRKEIAFMKKVVVIFFITVCIATIALSCSKIQTNNHTKDKTQINNLTLNFSFDKNGNYLGFSDLPSDYTFEKAKKDGFFARENFDIFANENVWNNFVQASLKKENTCIRMVQIYTKDTKAVYFHDIYYIDGYYYIFDSSAESNKKEPFSYLLTLEGKIGDPLRDSSAVILTNNNTLTFEKFMKAMFSSNRVVIKSIGPYEIIMLK